MVKGGWKLKEDIKKNKSEEKVDLLALFGLEDDIAEEEMNQRQWKILQAAINVFAEKGFEGSRTSEIAKEAEVAEGTIFRYYKTKKDLLMGLLIPFVSKFARPLILKSIEKIMENKDNEPIDEVLKKIFEDRIKLVKKNSKLLKTIFLEAIYHEELREELQKNLEEKIVPLIDKFMQKNVNKGIFKANDARFITRSFMSLLLGYVIFTSAFPDVFEVESDEIESQKMVDLMLNGFLDRENGGNVNG